MHFFLFKTTFLKYEYDCKSPATQNKMIHRILTNCKTKINECDQSVSGNKTNRQSNMQVVRMTTKM